MFKFDYKNQFLRQNQF